VIRRAALALLLAGCGYQPVGAPVSSRGPDPRVPLEITLTTDRDRGGSDRQRQVFRQALLNNLRGSTATPKLSQLAVRVDVQSQELVVRRDETPSRARITATARFAARRLAPDGTEDPATLGGTVVAVESYNFIDQEFFASDVAREAVEIRLAQQLATRITEALTVALR
jgi:hypothetical protein